MKLWLRKPKPQYVQVFANSRTYGAHHCDDGKDKTYWLWPRATWFQQRREQVRRGR